MQVRGVEPVALRLAGCPVLHEYVRVAHQLGHLGLPGRRANVGLDDPLVVVEGDEPRGAVACHRGHAAQRVPARWLDAHHLGAE